MTVSVIPLIATPSQTLNVQLGPQPCRVDVRQRRTGIFVDVYVQDVAVVLGVKALNLNKLIRNAYANFTGDLFFADTQGSSDPSYDGLGGRFQLLWDDAA